MALNFLSFSTRTVRLFGRVVLFGALLTAAGWAALTMLLPYYLQSALPRLAADAGIENFTLSPALVGASGMVGGFQIGSTDSPVLTVSSLLVSYSLPDLFRKKLREIRLNGVELHCSFEDGKLQFADAGLMRLLYAPPQEQNVDNKEPWQPPVTVDRLILGQATFICRIEGKQYRLPCAAEMAWEKKEGSNKLLFRCVLLPRGEEVVLQGNIDLDGQAGQLVLDAGTIDLKRFADIVNPGPGLYLETSFDLHGKADVQFVPLRFHEVSGLLTVHDPQISSGTFTLGMAAQEGKIPDLVIDLKVSQTDTGWELAGETAPHHLRAGINNLRFNAAASILKLHGAAASGKTDLHVQYDIPLEIDDDQMKFTCRRLQLDGVLTSASQGDVTAGGELRVDGGNLMMPQAEFQVAEINMALPVGWSLNNPVSPGTFSAGNIRWQGKELGSLKGKSSQIGLDYILTADLQGTLLPGITAAAELKMNLKQPGDISLDLTVPPYLMSAYDLGEIFPGGRGIYFSGLLRTDAAIKFGGQETRGRAEIIVQDGVIDMPEKEFKVSGVHGTMILPELPRLVSAPAQKLYIDSVNLQDIKIRNGNVVFRLESPDTVMIESGNFDWADGSIHSSAFRLSGNQPVRSLVLSCDTLKLATILGEIGLHNVTGAGTLNGRLPVTFDAGRITFEESYLYSTPGEGGVIRIGESDYLTRSMPLDTPRFAQLDFAQEALRDFNYSWAKLHIITEEENLVLQLNLDGKPAHPLPFVFDQGLGTFRRIHDKTGQGIFQPIRLDVNFRFPLNTFLGYDQSVKEMWDAVQ